MQQDDDGDLGWVNPTGVEGRFEELCEAYRMLRIASVLVHVLVGIGGIVAAFFVGAWALLCVIAIFFVVMLQVVAFMNEKRCSAFSVPRQGVARIVH